MTRQSTLGCLLLAMAIIGCGRPDNPDQAGGATVGDPGGATAVTASWRDDARQALARGATFLKANAQDGKWVADPREGKPHLGITALCVRALLSRDGDDPKSVETTLDWIASHQQEDGGIHDKSLATYNTSASVLALKASRDSKYGPALARAGKFLAAIQSDEGEGLEESSEDYGGVGYGGAGVINMSTTQLAIDAATEAGLSKDHKFYAKALKFLERSHNRSESNDHRTKLPDGTVVVPGNDGGGIYRPSESKAGTVKREDGRVTFRSYGSMTYALLKSYLLCNLDARDARVQAALGWIGENWQLDYNPGMEHVEKAEARFMGLYYYYLTLVRCLDVAEAQKVKLDAPALKDWRGQVAAAILSRQKDDGSWVNHQSRWFEANPALATAYAMIALDACLGAP